MDYFIALWFMACLRNILGTFPGEVAIMMREIKFRAWDEETQIMLEVVKIEWLGRTKIVNTKSFYDDRSKEKRFEQKNDISKLELMQVTGLKDKNGKEIYEGDIVSWGNQEGLWIEQVNKVEIVDDKFYALTGNVGLCTIIGNKFENPELLK